jgi:hypothetical protein
MGEKLNSRGDRATSAGAAAAREGLAIPRWSAGLGIALRAQALRTHVLHQPPAFTRLPGKIAQPPQDSPSAP